MKISKFNPWIGLTAGLLATLALTQIAWSQPRGRGPDARSAIGGELHGNRNQPKHGSNWQYDTKHGNNYYYPPRGSAIKQQPKGALTVRYRQNNLFFRDGIWWIASGANFVVVSPPLGVIIPALPGVYVTLRFGPNVYYYANDVYYTAAPGGFVVSAPPPAPIYAPPPAPVYPTTPNGSIYPRNGQNPAQTAADRSYCEQWAAAQPGGRDGAIFARGVTACMDARGYSIR
jgi:hypothetical protein